MPLPIPRCRLLPLPDYQVSFQVDGAERLRWHFGPSYPRPFFYPFLGPTGSSLTRLGHPGAPDHEHHRSLWFAHAKVLGIDFWSDQSAARIRQKQWLIYQDGEDEAALAVLLGWYDGHDPKELLEQELIAALRPGPDGETFLELQATFRPTAESLEFGKSNYGFLAVRVAKNLAVDYGGQLTGSTGATGQPDLVNKPARWMDYSGPVPKGGTEGITYFDHPTNPGHPAHWIVREDGWMGAAVCLDAPVPTTRKQPLVLRYLLHAHRGPVTAEQADRLAKEFAARSAFEVVRAREKHQQYAVQRLPPP